MPTNFASSTSEFRTSEFRRWDLVSNPAGWRHHGFARCAVRFAAVGCMCIMSAGCLPGDATEQTGKAPSPSFPLSNLADKSDRWDVVAKRQADAAPQTAYRVATTATVVPTSASAEPRRSGESRFPASADVPAREALRGFYDALAALDSGDRSRPVTIVHLGDGHIAADRFTATLRTRLQARFGDAGRGLMAPGLFRVEGADIVRSGNWTTASSVAGDPGPFGLAGVRLTMQQGASLEVSMPRAPFDWAEIMFSTNRDTGKVRVEVDGKGDTVGTSTMEPTWQRIRVKAGGATLKLRAEGGGPVHVLSLAVGRDTNGLRYINLGVPQATALTPQRWADDVVAAELKHLSPDLLVIGYGTNEAFNNRLDGGEYASAFAALLARLKSAAPDASVLVIGPPDVAHVPRFAAGRAADACRALSEAERADYAKLVRQQNLRLGRWHPPLRLRTVRRAARRAAAEAGAYFWDWSAMMGGPCSVHAWVHAQPPLASASHRHFTPAGARHSAEALFRDLLNGYERYRMSAKAARAPE